MHRGCVNNFPISAKMARERSAWSPIDSNSDGPLRLWWTTDFGSVSANAAESAMAAEQPIDTVKQNERTSIAASSQIRKVSATRANLFRSAGALCASLAATEGGGLRDGTWRRRSSDKPSA